MVSNLALVAVVSSYSTRIKTLFHELCNASVVGKTAAEAMIIREHIKGQTLAIFIEGLRQPMKTIIKAGKPASFELAIKESLEEERVYKSNKESQRFFNNPKPGGKTRYCSRCKTNTHQTENCGFIKGTQTGKHNQSTNTQTKIETVSHSGEGEKKKKSYCIFCKIPGHDIMECREKKRQEGQRRDHGTTTSGTTKGRNRLQSGNIDVGYSHQRDNCTTAQPGSNTSLYYERRRRQPRHSDSFPTARGGLILW
ncbi:hypothetical protein QTP88_024015 [Uroleucon formosanum]